MISRSGKEGLVRFAPEVAWLLAEGGAVVGLESVAFAHGFSDSIGAELAVECMERVSEVGAMPAVVFIDDGRVQFESDVSQALAFFEQSKIRKLGTRDIADAIRHKERGALTIGATAAVCDQHGIRVVSTGGLGGVHLGFAQSLDISADLYEVANANVIVVSAGVKPVLDVAATFEVLETLGVPLLGWRTSKAPTFYGRESDYRVTARVEDASEVAEFAIAHWSLGLGGGLLVLRPPTTEVEVDSVLAAGLEEVQRRGIRGQDVTPFLLDWLDNETDGATVIPHQELLLDNVELAAEVSVQLSNQA